MPVAPRDDVSDVSPLEAEGVAVVAFEGVSVWRSDGGSRTMVLDEIDWLVRPGEHWGIIGANGAGKTTLLRVAAAQTRPSSGSATILGGRLGRVSMPALRRRIGFIEPAIARRFYPGQRALDVVLSGMSGTILPTDEPDQAAVEQARELLRSVGMHEFGERTFASCSEGERVRILLARALAAEASFLAFDEPAAGLDLPGRELLLAALANAIRERPGLTTLTVTHHIEELPATTSHALLLRAGAVVAAGPVAEVFTDATLSECFGLALQVDHRDGRFFVHVG
jgi:iron complex transport system ATP-binding protein